MKHHLCAAVAAALLITGAAQADGFKRITKEADFRTVFVGKNLSFPGGIAVIRGDGKTDGRLDRDGKYYGAWVWQKGYYCRNLVIKNKQTGTNCQLVEFNGTQGRLTRDQGKGRASIITIR